MRYHKLLISTSNSLGYLLQIVSSILTYSMRINSWKTKKRTMQSIETESLYKICIENAPDIEYRYQCKDYPILDYYRTPPEIYIARYCLNFALIIQIFNCVFGSIGLPCVKVPLLFSTSPLERGNVMRSRQKIRFLVGFLSFVSGLIIFGSVWYYSYRLDRQQIYLAWLGKLTDSDPKWIRGKSIYIGYIVSTILFFASLLLVMHSRFDIHDMPAAGQVQIHHEADNNTMPNNNMPDVVDINASHDMQHLVPKELSNPALTTSYLDPEPQHGHGRYLKTPIMNTRKPIEIPVDPEDDTNSMWPDNDSQSFQTGQSQMTTHFSSNLSNLKTISENQRLRIAEAQNHSLGLKSKKARNHRVPPLNSSPNKTNNITDNRSDIEIANVSASYSGGPSNNSGNSENTNPYLESDLNSNKLMHNSQATSAGAGRTNFIPKYQNLNLHKKGASSQRNLNINNLLDSGLGSHHTNGLNSQSHALSDLNLRYLPYQDQVGTKIAYENESKLRDDMIQDFLRL